MRSVSRAQIQIELVPSRTANPPLLDLVTGLPPSFFCESAIAFLFAFFDLLGNLMDASTVVAMTVALYDAPVAGTLIGRWAVAAADIRSEIAILDWRNATDFQALVSVGPLSPDQIAMMDFGATGHARAWMVINAATTDGFPVVMAAGWVDLQTGAPPDVYLPLIPIPLVIPAGTTYFIPAGVQITFPQSPQIIGAIVTEPAKGLLPAGSWTVANT